MDSPIFQKNPLDTTGTNNTPMTSHTSIISPLRVMLMGATGSGKTYSLKSLSSLGLETFVLFTEPGQEVLAHTDPNLIHWHYIPPECQSWEDMKNSASMINRLTFKSLTEMQDLNKAKHSEFLKVITTCMDFIDDRTGKSYGCIDAFDSSKVFVIDSLSGLNIMAMNLVVGSKPVRAKGDWGVAMDNLERFLIRLTTSLQCHFVLTAHLEREIDEGTGGTTLMASTLGRKLAPRLSRFFSDVIMPVRMGKNFSWSTAAMNVDLKAQHLPISDNLPPNFSELLRTWKLAEIACGPNKPI